jgi:hypothetical protein
MRREIAKSYLFTVIPERCKASNEIPGSLRAPE